MSISPLDKTAGGWRWAILVVSVVILLEVLLAVSSGVAKESESTWPHTPILLVLTVANLFLVIAAFVNLPYGDTPANYLTVTRGLVPTWDFSLRSLHRAARQGRCSRDFPTGVRVSRVGYKRHISTGFAPSKRDKRVLHPPMKGC